MTSTPDMQNVPDVWAILQEIRERNSFRAHVDLMDLIDDALAVRDRFVLVPREPTQEMRRAGVGQWMHGEAEAESRARYIAMLAAAPKPEGKP